VGGFIDNGNTASLRLENNTAWDNGGSGFIFNRSTSTLNRNLAVSNGGGVNLGSSGGSGNSWDIKDDWSDADVVSTGTSVIKGPRGADGPIPATEFLFPRDHPDLGADFSGDGGDPGRPVRYEAEDAPAVCAGSLDANHAGYSGTGFCNSDHVSGAAARFTVEAAVSGTAAVRIHYANGGASARPADIVVNGATARSISLGTTGPWSDWAAATVTLRLNAGVNTIQLTATGSGGLPNIDCLDVSTGSA
jgi:hypothetical protein